MEHSHNTALLVSMKQISLKLGGKLITLALTAKKRFQPVGLSSDRIKTNKAVIRAS